MALKNPYGIVVLFSVCHIYLYICMYLSVYFKGPYGPYWGP